MVDDAAAALADSVVAAKTSQQLFTNAVQAGAATIHLEPDEKIAKVRYRIDGLLHECGELSHNALATLIAHYKHRAQLRPDERRWPQEGRFAIRLDDGSNYEINVATFPLVKGEKAVLQIAKTPHATADITELGIWGSTAVQLRRQLAQPNGLLVVSGTNQRQISITLRSIAQLLLHPTKSVMSIGTAAHRLPKVHHLHAHSRKGISVADSLRAATQQADNNVVIVSELHNRAELNLALEAANRGHLIITGLSAPSTAHAINHLQAMANEDFMLASSLTGILHQRTIRRLCDNCKSPAKPSAQTLRTLTGNSKITIGMLQKFVEQSKQQQATTANIQLFAARVQGCARCHHTGYKGELGLFEFLPITEKIERSLTGRAHAMGILHQAVKNGMMPATIDGFVKALCGITTLEEVIHSRPRSK